jgi:hypothetical protein
MWESTPPYSGKAFARRSLAVIRRVVGDGALVFDGDGEPSVVTLPAHHRYLCTSGHHVVSRRHDLAVCSAPWPPFADPLSLPCGAPLQRYEWPDFEDAEEMLAEIARLRAVVEPRASTDQEREQ